MPPLLAALQVLVLTGAAAALPVVQERTTRLVLRAELAGGTVALRGRGTEGLLWLRVTNPGRLPVEVRQVALLADGAEIRAGSRPDLSLRAGRSGLLRLRYAVPRCRGLGPAAEVRLAAAAADGRSAGLVVPLADAVAAGCGRAVVPDVSVVGVRATGGQAETGDQGGSATGTVVLEVVSAGAPVRLVAVTAEVPGALFVSPSLAPEEPLLPAGARRRVRVPFTVPFCPSLRPIGQVAVTVRSADDVLHELRFAVAADGEARVARDVDLDVALRACAGSTR